MVFMNSFCIIMDVLFSITAGTTVMENYLLKCQ